MNSLSIGGQIAMMQPEAPDAGQSEPADLMRRIAGGDRDAYTILVRRHAVQMLSLARHMLGATGEAEEIVQDICLRLWRQPEIWRPDRGAFRSWLDRVIVNACLDRIRRRRWHGGEVSEEWPDPAPDAMSVLAAAEEQVAVRQAILQLPERQRAAVLLVEYRGMRQEEAARSMGLSLEALESLLARARRKLKVLLAPVLDKQLDKQKGERDAE
ncbi:MAG: sigma-70 family RNA polymerase sigma factor [Alphaproteobacteria bacterium]